MKYLKLLLTSLPLLVTLTGCMGGESKGNEQNGQAQDNLYFLSQKPSDGPTMEGILQGQLVVSEKCLYIEAEDSSAYAAIWPTNYSLARQGNSIQVLNNDKGVVAQVGEQVRVSGGRISQPSPKDFEARFEGSATQCTAPYWVVSEVVERVEP